MAIVLPAVGTWPGQSPVGVLEPGCRHLETHVQRLVETEHYLCAYYGAQHFSQVWPEQLGTGYSLLHFIGPPTSVVLEQVFLARHHTAGLIFPWRADGGEAGGEIRLRVLGVAGTAFIAVPAGISEGVEDLPSIYPGDGVNTLEVALTRNVGSTYLDLWALGCYDLNLTQAQLAAL